MYRMLQTNGWRLTNDQNYVLNQHPCSSVFYKYHPLRGRTINPQSHDKTITDILEKCSGKKIGKNQRRNWKGNWKGNLIEKRIEKGLENIDNCVARQGCINGRKKWRG